MSERPASPASQTGLLLCAAAGHSDSSVATDRAEWLPRQAGACSGRCLTMPPSPPAAATVEAAAQAAPASLDCLPDSLLGHIMGLVGWEHG